VFFSDLPGEEARRLFGKFVRRWNRGELNAHIYAGVHSTDADLRRPTDHDWRFGAKVDRTELEALRKTVDHDTFERTAASASVSTLTSGSALAGGAGSATVATASVKPRHATIDYDPDARTDERQRQRQADKTRVKEFIEENAPKSTGREARVDERRARATLARARAGSPELAEVDVYGDGRKRAEPSLQDMLARRERAASERRQAAGEKIAQYAAREDERMAHLRELAKSRFGAAS
jgi:hypothetical protein